MLDSWFIGSLLMLGKVTPSTGFVTKNVWRARGVGNLAWKVQTTSTSRPTPFASSPGDTEQQAQVQSYWTSEEEPWKLLHDPPPPHILRAIKEQPHRGGFEPTKNVDWYAPEILEGSIPRDLQGTLAVAGPGRIRIDARQFGHWFDGDGYVTSLVLDGDNNRAWFCGRYVETQRYKDQQRLLDSSNNKHTGRTTTNIDDDDGPPLAFSGAWTKKGRGEWYENLFAIPKNPSNTATLWLSAQSSATNEDAISNKTVNIPRLFVLCEGGQPIQIDPLTLKAIRGETKMDPNIQSFFSAHFSRCPTAATMSSDKQNLASIIYNHGHVLRPFLSPQINVMKLVEEASSSSGDSALKLVEQQAVELPYDTFVHDSALSKNYLGYVTTPWAFSGDGKMDMIQFLLGQKPLAKSYCWQPDQGTFLYLHSKEDSLKLHYKIRLPKDGVSLYHLMDLHDEIIANSKGEDEIVIRIRVAELDDQQKPGIIDRTNHRPTLEEQFSNPYKSSTLANSTLNCRLTEYECHCKKPTSIARASDASSYEDNGVQVVEHNLSTRSGAAPCEFPTMNANYAGSTLDATAAASPFSRKRYCWTNALSTPDQTWLDGIQKVDFFSTSSSSSHDLVAKDDDNGTTPVKTFGEGCFAGAPLFIPLNPSKEGDGSGEERKEDEGYVISMIYCSKEHCSDVVILDASNLQTLCRIRLRDHVPFQFHGEFLPDFKAHGGDEAPL
jgi:all-trans-8'-apo-beta-carotenal 15,15'-oxygenase